MKPVVDRLSKEFKGRVEFRRYDVDAPGSDGQRLATKMGVQYVPTFVFVNADGSGAGQVVGGMSEQALRARLESLK